MSYKKIIAQIILYAIGITLIIEGIFLNIAAIITNDAQFMFQGTGLIFIGAISLGTSKAILEAKEKSA